jgi:hypothetical protein
MNKLFLLTWRWDYLNIMNDGNRFFIFPPIINGVQDDRLREKMAHDRYNVYVNGDYVGDKILMTQGDGGWRSIEDYLKSRNFGNYSITCEGDRVYIDVEDEDEREAIRNHLRVYTQLR